MYIDICEVQGPVFDYLVTRYCRSTDVLAYHCMDIYISLTFRVTVCFSVGIIRM